MRMLLLAAAAIGLAATGCTTCASPYDNHFSAFGGRWERDLPDHGRVASAFTEAGYQVEDVLEEENHDPAVEAEPNQLTVQTISYESPLDYHDEFE